MTELDKAIRVIASRTTREEFKNIKSVMYGLFCGASFGFDESGLAFRVHLDQQYITQIKTDFTREDYVW